MLLGKLPAGSPVAPFITSLMSANASGVLGDPPIRFLLVLNAFAIPSCVNTHPSIWKNVLLCAEDIEFRSGLFPIIKSVPGPVPPDRCFIIKDA